MHGNSEVWDVEKCSRYEGRRASRAKRRWGSRKGLTPTGDRPARGSPQKEVGYVRLCLRF
jgi:hypothetical protein